METSNGVNKQNLDRLEGELLKRLKAREKKRKTRMKVSGGSVKKLQRILVRRSLGEGGIIAK